MRRSSKRLAWWAVVETGECPAYRILLTVPRRSMREERGREELQDFNSKTHQHLIVHRKGRVNRGGARRGGSQRGSGRNRSTHATETTGCFSKRGVWLSARELLACHGTNGFHNRDVVGDLQEQFWRSGEEESLTRCVQGEMD